MSSANTNDAAGRGFPRFKLPFAGVAVGCLWVAGAFAALFYCFATNYINTLSAPAEELAISNAAARRAAAEAVAFDQSHQR